MAIDLLIPDSGDLYQDAVSHTVYTRQHWADAWSAENYFYANWVRFGSGPVRSQAELIWHYGDLKPPGVSGLAAFSPYDPKTLLGHYVKIKIDQGEDDPVIWYGIITDDARRQDGAFQPGGGFRQPSGQQIFTAEGLELLLLRAPVTTANILKSDSTVLGIERGLTFNDPNTFDNTGNRSASCGPTGSFLFANDLYGAQYWTTRTILEYLLHWHAPANVRGVGAIRWELSDNAKTILPNWDRPVIKTHDRSLFSIINELCDRRRLLSWRLTIEAEGEDPDGQKTVYLDCFPFVGEALQLPGGGTQEANQNLKQIDFDRAVDVQAVLRDTDHDRVEQVIARGARRRAIVSLSYQDGTLEADWKAADETDYETGPAGVAGLDVDRKQRRIWDYRAKDALARVFSWLRLPASWAGLVGDGVGGGNTTFFPVDPLTGDTPSIYVAELHFERTLPPELIDNAPTNSPYTILPPLGIIKVESDGGTDRYQFLDRLASAAEIEGMGDGAGRRWSASLRIQAQAPGVIVRVTGGKDGCGQHMIGGSGFTPITGIDKAAELDWQDIIVTVCIELDDYAEEKYPATEDIGAAEDQGRIFYVDLAERARLDWLHEKAVIGIEDGILQYNSGAAPSVGRYIRDDTTMLADWAKFVYQWYGTKRQAFTLQLRQVSSIVEVGDLITQIGDLDTEEEVNSVVTGIHVDLLQQVTRITTAYAELDPLQFL